MPQLDLLYQLHVYVCFEISRSRTKFFPSVMEDGNPATLAMPTFLFWFPCVTN
jgi:hypothetical protein